MFEALVTEWPLLRHWLNENRQSLRLQQELAEAARDWAARSRSEDYLYQGARLLEVEEWSAAHPGELNPTEVAFIEAGAALRDREQTEAEAQRQRELAAAAKLAAEQKRRAEAIRRALVGVVLLLLAAIGAAIFAFFKQQEAQENANLAATKQAEALTNANLAATREAEAQRQANIAFSRQLAAQAAAEPRLDLALL